MAQRQKFKPRRLLAPTVENFVGNKKCPLCGIPLIDAVDNGVGINKYDDGKIYCGACAYYLRRAIDANPGRKSKRPQP